MTTQELIVKSELKYGELVTHKFNIASLTLALSSDPTLKLFTGVCYRLKRTEEVEINLADLSRNVRR